MFGWVMVENLPDASRAPAASTSGYIWRQKKPA
jgi:hypothetical protein